MDLGLRNKVAVVFAASKGLGKAAAQSLASEQCKVAMCSSNEKNIIHAANEIRDKTKSEVFAYKVNLERTKEIEEFIQKILDKWGKVDILVTNVGGPPVKTFEETTNDEWEKYFKQIVMSVITAIRSALPVMKKQKWGRIINITSIAVKEPIMNLVYSNALRMAVVGLAKTLSKEIGEYGITVHNVAPGFHHTEGLERIVKKRIENGEDAEQVYAEWRESVPLKKIGEPDELAALITFLASEKSSYMTGTTIQVDGGRYSGTM